MRSSKQRTRANPPRAGDQLDDGAEEQERAVEGQTGRLPVGAQQPVQHFEPLVNITFTTHKIITPSGTQQFTNKYVFIFFLAEY